MALTDTTGTVVQNYSYDAFGKVYSSNSSNTYSNSRLYTGREYDRETGLYYNRARYYDSDTGRFLSRDPIGQNDQVNLYTYVRNNPLMYTDRDGKTSKPLAVVSWINQLYSTLLKTGNNPTIQNIQQNSQFASFLDNTTKSSEEMNALFQKYSQYSWKSIDGIREQLEANGYSTNQRPSIYPKSNAQIIEIGIPQEWGNITQVQVSAGGWRHWPSPYTKISTSDDGIIKIVDWPESTYKVQWVENAKVFFTEESPVKVPVRIRVPIKLPFFW